MVDIIKEDLGPPSTPLVVRVRFLVGAVGEADSDADHLAWKVEVLSWGDGRFFPTMSQAFSRAEPSFMATPLLARPLWKGLVSMPWWNSRCPWIVLGNVPSIHVSYSQYSCMPLVIINSVVFLRFSLPIIPFNFWFITRHTWGQLSPGIVCTRECNSLWWPAAGFLPRCSSSSGSGDYLLNRNGVSHGAGWECRFLFDGSGRRGRH